MYSKVGRSRSITGWYWMEMVDAGGPPPTMEQGLHCTCNCPWCASPRDAHTSLGSWGKWLSWLPEGHGNWLSWLPAGQTHTHNAHNQRSGDMQESEACENPIANRGGWCQKQRYPTVDIRFVNVGSRCAREFHNLWMKCQEHKCYTIDIKKYMSTRIAQGRDPQSPHIRFVNVGLWLHKGITQSPHVRDDLPKTKMFHD